MDQNTLYFELTSEPDTLNPITATDAYSHVINYGSTHGNSHIYEYLIQRNWDSLEIEPLLATHWKRSADKLKYTFYLRKGVQWSDGVEFTADDVIYSYERIKDPNVLCPQWKVYFVDVISAKKIDDYTVKFTYKRPYSLALEYCGSIPIVAKHIFDDGTDFNSHKNNRKPVGTGPYIFKKWESNKQIVLERNENYWGKKPAIKRIMYKVIKESYVSLEMLKKGDLDVIGVRAIQWIKQTNSDSFKANFDKYMYYRPNFSYIGWNLRKPYFSDKRVRRALTQLINREEILQKLLYGNGKIVTGNFFIFSKYYNQQIQPWPYDPGKARQLFREAGWVDSDNDGILDKDGVKFSFVFLIPSGSEFQERFSAMLKEDFSKVGIEVAIHRFEWAVFLSKIYNRDFDATMLAWSLDYTADPYQLWHSSQIDKGSNYVGFVNQEADQIIEQARVEFDENKKIKLFHRFHEILHEEQPYTFLFCTPALAAVSKRFDNVKVHTMGLKYTEWTIKK